MKFNTRRVIIFLYLLGVFPLCNSWPQVLTPLSDENTALVYAQIDKGIELYGSGLWGEAIIQLRRVQQEKISAETRAEAQFWIAMSAFAAEQYEEAIAYFDEIARIDPGNIRCVEVPYHKGRAYYYLKRYNEAIRLLGAYADSIRIDGRYLGGVRLRDWNDNGLYSGTDDNNYNRKSAAIYWMGECFYTLSDMTHAEELFNIVVNDYPKSHKFEPASNRLSLIKQKKIETELLDILRSVPSESDSQSGVTSGSQKQTTEEAILAYQKRIAPYLITGAYNERLKDSGVTENAPPEKKLNQKNIDGIMRLLAVKTKALEMMDKLVSTVNTYEIVEEEEW